MAFTVRDYRDLLQLLAEHPEWREELRRALFTEDFLALPQMVQELVEIQKQTLLIVKELIEAHKRAEERLTQLEVTVAELVEAQKRTEQRVNELAEAQKRTEESLAALVQRVDRIELILAELIQRVDRLDQRVDHLDQRLTKVEQRLAKVDGRTLEIEYERKAMSYFGQILRRPMVVNLGELEERVETFLSDQELQDLWRADLVIQGRLRQPIRGAERPEAWLAVEVSVLVDREDIERAEQRAALLRKAGFMAFAVAAGEDVTEKALLLAEERGVILIQDGSVRFIDKALQRIPPANN